MTDVFLHVGALDMDTTASRRAFQTNETALNARGHILIRRRLVVDEATTPAWSRLINRSRSDSDAGLVLAADHALSRLDVGRRNQLISDIESSVKVVITARPLHVALPALWAEAVRRDHETATLEDFANRLIADAQVQPATMNVADLAASWARTVDAKNVVVVTNSGGSQFRWQRFWEALGFDPDGLEADTHVEGLGALTTELERRVNERAVLADQPVKHSLGERPGEPMAAIPPALFDACRAATDTVTSSLLEHGVAIVGDIADLQVSDPTRGGITDPESLPAQQLLDAAIHDLIDLATPMTPTATTLA